MRTSEAADRSALVEQVTERPDELALALSELSGLLLADEGLESTLRRLAEHRVDAEGAFDLLRERSQRENRKLRDVARDVIDSIT